MKNEITSVAICGEVYSTNLGDGVIADSLAYLIKQADSKITVSHIDFSGRVSVASQGFTSTSWVRRTYRHSLASVRICRKVAAIPSWQSKRKGLRTYWREKLADCGLMIIGGGQLLMDNDLSFLLRIRELIRIAHEMDIDVVFHACGVGRKWSRMGLNLLRESLSDEIVSRVSVRDNGSLNTLLALLPRLKCECRVAMDPALIAAEAYSIQLTSGARTIGLGITAPHTIKKHVAISAKQIKQFWIELAIKLSHQQQPFNFFTNGSPDDHAFAEDIFSNLRGSEIALQAGILDRARSPRELVAQVAQFRAVVAHRLHANIIAYSLQIPSVGLVWDQKVSEFGSMIGRQRFFVDIDQLEADVICQRLREAINVGVNESRVAEVKAALFRSAEDILPPSFVMHR